MNIHEEVLRALDTQIEEALRQGTEEDLEILGYGEVSCVLGFECDGKRFAAKRLPPFPDRQRFEAYEQLFNAYLDALRGAGVEPVASTLETISLAGGAIQAYCIQPRLESDALGPRYLEKATKEEGRLFISGIVESVCKVVDQKLGLDAQLSNWAIDDGRLVYLDITTPLMRDDGGRNRLDTSLFLASLPWALRSVVRAFMIDDVIDHYHTARSALLDMAANLLKEHFEEWLPVVLQELEGRVQPPITLDEIHDYYRQDARTWTLLLTLRRLDRGWQRRIRRRTYSFLLPGPIER